MTLSGTIINAVVILMAPRPELIQSGYVTVKDGVISEIGQGAPRQAEPGWFIDAHGSVLMPGLVNAHTYLYQVLLRAIWEDVALFPWLKKIYGAARVSRVYPAQPKLRIWILVAVMALVAISPSVGFGQTLQEIRIGSSVIGFSSLITYAARDLKFFEKEGFDAKIIYAQTNVILAALTAGNVDYTNLATSGVEATLRGMPLRLITVTNGEPLWGIVVRQGITQISDLKGKKLGVSSFGGTSYSAALYVLKHFGLRPKEDVVIIATGGTTERIAALKHGSVDAAIIPAPGDMKAEEEGFKILMDAGMIYKLPNGGMSTTLNKIRQSPGEVRRVASALVLATKFFVEQQNKAEVTRYLSRAFNLDPDSTDRFYRRFIPSLTPNGTVEMDKIKLIVDGALDRGLISKPVDPETLVDFSFVKRF